MEIKLLANNNFNITKEVESIKDPALHYINEEIKIGDISKYEVTSKIGKGRYSEVFAGIKLNSNKQVVIKLLRPVNKTKIKREIYIVKYLKGCPNCAQLIDITKGEENEIYCLIFNNISGYELRKFSINIDPEDLKIYIYKILKCLDYCHSKKIIHRDIKSGNIVVNSLTKELNVIDFGLSEYYIKDYKYCTRVGTRYYKSPELLLDYKKYDFAIDIWSVGCIFGAILFQIDFLFKGEDINDQIIKVANVFGYQEFQKYLNKYKNNCRLSRKVEAKIKDFTKKEWKSLINSKNKYLINDDALDLLDKLLKFDQEERINASEALKHPYFSSIKFIAEDTKTEDKKE